MLLYSVGQVGLMRAAGHVLLTTVPLRMWSPVGNYSLRESEWRGWRCPVRRGRWVGSDASGGGAVGYRPWRTAGYLGEHSAIVFAPDVQCYELARSRKLPAGMGVLVTVSCACRTLRAWGSKCWLVLGKPWGQLRVSMGETSCTYADAALSLEALLRETVFSNFTIVAKPVLHGSSLVTNKQIFGLRFAFVAST